MMNPAAPRPVPGWLRILAWIGVGLWAGSICVLSSMGPDQLVQLTVLTFWDKAEHFFAFAVGAANLALVLRWSTRWPPARLLVATIAAISLFGAADEIHQLFTPGRSGGDFLDWTADTLGAVVGAWTTLLIYARYSRSCLLAPARD
jgi:VanZ family protein